MKNIQWLCSSWSGVDAPWLVLKTTWHGDNEPSELRTSYWCLN